MLWGAWPARSPALNAPNAPPTLHRPPHHPQIRDAYISLRHWPKEHVLRQLLTQAAARMAVVARKARARADTRRRVQLKQRSQLFDKVRRERRKRLRQLRFGQGWPATQRQQAAAERGERPEATWYQRRMRPPGRMWRRF